MGSQLKKLNKKNGNDETRAFLRGKKEGREEGVKETIMYFAERLETLNEVEGIGTKTYAKIIEHIEGGFKKK